MRYPILCQKNVRLWLAEISETLGRPAALDDIPDEALKRLSDSGFDWLYLICMWATGEAEAEIARRQPGLQKEARQMLEGEASSLCSSCFAISGYQVPEDWGGQAALERLRGRMRSCGLKLMLDFIPNHTGISHPWARSHPEYFIEADL